MSGRKRSSKARARSRTATAKATGGGTKPARTTAIGRPTATAATPRAATTGSTTPAATPAEPRSTAPAPRLFHPVAATLTTPAPTPPPPTSAPAPPPPTRAPRAQPRVFHPVAAHLTIPPPPFADPEAAFDALHAHGAAQLVRQVELLTGDGELARQAVRRAYDVAWQRWPEVARDSDPVGWVRAQAHAYALAPWQRWVPGRRRAPVAVSASGSSAASTPASASPSAGEPGTEDLRQALLRLGPERRRAVLLYDGLGLDLPATATEVEASTIATAARVIAARQTLAEDVPGVYEDGGLPAHLAALLTVDAEPDAEPGREETGGAAARAASERGVRHRTAASLALAGVVVLAIAVAMIVAPDHGAPRHPDDPGPGPALSQPR